MTPVCIASEPAERYYESLGRTWERAAYIKARPCAGAIAAGEAFLERLNPFIWRRHLDFAAIEDAQDIRRRIRSHKRLTGPLSVPGHDLKLGQGGIRDIEFFTQTRQLIVGGRDPGAAPARDADRARGPRRQGLGRSAPTATTLAEAYVAHRDARAPAADARGRPDPAAARKPRRAGPARRLLRRARSPRPSSASLRARLATVHALTEPFFVPDARPQDAPAPAQIFADPEAASAMIAAWSRLPALRSERARALFRRLEPELMRRIAGAASPDAALVSLDAFLSGLPAGVRIFSLMQANPPLLDLLVDICGTAPRARPSPRQRRRRPRRGDQPRLLPAAARRRRAPRPSRRPAAAGRRLRGGAEPRPESG